MARLPRFVLPGEPQCVIQRGNNKDIVFARDDDYRFDQSSLTPLIIDSGGTFANRFNKICKPEQLGHGLTRADLIRCPGLPLQARCTL